MATLEERFVGSMLGLALGDALGAGYEGTLGGELLGRANAASEHPLTWTDDTQMAIGLAVSLIECGGLDADRLAARWAASMQPTRGYGAGARRLLTQIRTGVSWQTANRSVFPDGSYGNGAAMRAAPLGLRYHRDLAELRRATALASSITHAHPWGIEGGLLVARAVAMALDGPLDLDAIHAFCGQEVYRERLRTAKMLLSIDAPLDDVRRRLGNGVLAPESAVTAIYAASRFANDFDALIGFVIALGGDTDTIGAMAGGIFGARHGMRALPAEAVSRLEQRTYIEALARSLYQATLG